MFREISTARDSDLSRQREKRLTIVAGRLWSLRLVDYLTIGYLGLVGLLIMLFGQRIPHWYLLILAHAGVIGLLLLLIRTADGHNSRILTFFRDAYPFFLYTLFFEEINLIVNIFFPFWLETWLITWDYTLFGTHPTVWVQKLFHPWLNEFMAFAYWSYYVTIPAAGVVLYLRKDRRLYHSYVFNLSLTLYLCYFSFLFLTARGPHETLAHLHIDRAVTGFFDTMVHSIQSHASVSGAAFPSSHVAAVWVVLVYMFRFKKYVGWLLTPLIISLSVSVVYMQYHYAVDSIAAIALVALTYPLGRVLERRFGTQPPATDGRHKA